MKKALLALALMASAANAVAFDELVVGTNDAPQYYLLYANRGTNRYLHYSAEAVEVTRGEDVVETHLDRTAAPTLANVWAVTPGTEEGTIVVKNYTAEAYLMSFFKPGVEGETFEINATATTRSTARDIYPVQWPGTVAYALNVEAVEHPQGEYYSLDAPGGASVYVGNWQPTNPANGEGTPWWFVDVTPTAGKTVQDMVNDYYANFVKAEALTFLSAYLPNCGVVATQLQAGIDAINALPYSEDLADKVLEAKNAAIEAANSFLATGLTGKYILTNQRRQQKRYLMFNADDENLFGTDNFTAPEASISFKAYEEGGYFMYNEATKLYMMTADRIGDNVQVTEEEDDATIVYPCLASFGDFYGIAFPENPGTQYPVGINMHGTNLTRAVDLWYITTDAYGSIWTVEELTDQVIVNNVAAGVEAALKPYISSNVPAEVISILTKAIADVKTLPVTADIVDKALAIQEKAIEDANAWFATNLGGKSWLLKNLRRNVYLAVTEDGFNQYSAEDAQEAAEEVTYEFVAAEDGGFMLYNAASKMYLSEPIDALFDLTEEKDEAVVLYVHLAFSGDFHGVALSMNEDGSGQGLNLNYMTDKAHVYSAADAGSMFGIFAPTTLAINEIGVEAPAARGIYDLQGRRLAAPAKGINIINGQKVLVK